MSSAQYRVPNFNADDAATYKATLDGNAQVALQTAAAFSAYAQIVPNMTLIVAAGTLTILGVPTIKALQFTPTFSAPVTNPRIDRIVLSVTTGIISVLTGAEAAVPVPLTVGFGFSPICQVSLAVGVAALTNSMITDERTVSFGQFQYTVTQIDLERMRRRARLFSALNF